MGMLLSRYFNIYQTCLKKETIIFNCLFFYEFYFPILLLSTVLLLFFCNLSSMVFLF